MFGKYKTVMEFLLKVNYVYHLHREHQMVGRFVNMKNISRQVWGLGCELDKNMNSFDGVWQSDSQSIYTNAGRIQQISLFYCGI